MEIAKRNSPNCDRSTIHEIYDLQLAWYVLSWNTIFHLRYAKSVTFYNLSLSSFKDLHVIPSPAFH